MRKSRKNILVAKSGLGLYPAGQAVFRAPKKSGRGAHVNVLPGQLVIYDPITLLAVDAAAIALGKYPRLVIGVGHDTNGDGYADAIRKVAGDELYTGYIDAVTAEPSRCGTVEVHDLLFDCIYPEEAHSIVVTVEDDFTQNTFPYNRAEEYTFTVKLDSEDCAGCDDTRTCQEIACKFEQTFNGDLEDDPTLQSVFVRGQVANYPFKLVRLFDTSDVYCLDKVGDGCSTCNRVTAITGITIGEEDPIEFTNVTDPSDSAYSFEAQLWNIVDQINEALDGNGSAVITGNTGSCCPLQLEINTCLVYSLQSGEDDLTPCSTSNPLAAIPQVHACKNCDEAPADKTYTCGLRVIANRVDLDCNCQFPPNPPLGYLSRKVRISAGAGFPKGSTYSRKVQEATFPEGSGYQAQWDEYTQDYGGSGRDYLPYNFNRGPLSLPNKNSRMLNAVTADCDENYCTIAITHRLPHSDDSVKGELNLTKMYTKIYIPTSDVDTQTEFTDAINAITANCAWITSTIECTSDQDQNATYATGTLTLTNVAVEDETVTIGNKVYTWKDAPAAANEVKTELTASAAIDNLIAAINGAAGAGTLYGTGTVAHTQVRAAAGAGDTMVVTAIVAGSAANAYATTDTMGNGSWGALTLTGGADYTTGTYHDSNGMII